MIGQKLKNTFQKGLSGALLEIVLIFVGITLAIGFENWNTERKEREEELELLADLQSNLEENLVLLDAMADFNQETIDSLETVLEHIETKKPYSDKLNTQFALIDNWSSPYLTASAYATLKSRGLEIISDNALRHKIVKLFEVRYVHLANDYDRAEWINYEIYVVPMMIKHFEETPDNKAVPVDYDALLVDQQFKSAIMRTLSLRSSGIGAIEANADETAQVISAIAEAVDR